MTHARAGAVACALLAAACARRPPAPAAPAPATTVSLAEESVAPSPSSAELPAVAPVRGPLALAVVYPPADAVLRVRDSSFLFGTAGSGDAEVTVDGQAARVWPNGAWLAYVALPADSSLRLRIMARRGADSTWLEHPVRRVVPESGRRAVGAAWIDSLSFEPLGRLWLARDEFLTLGVRAAEGAAVRLRLPDGTVIPLVPQPQRRELPAGVRAFESDTLRFRTPESRDHYAGVLRGRAVGPAPGPMLPLGPPPIPSMLPDSAWPVLEAIIGPDTVRVRWPLQVAVLDTLPIVAELDDDSAGTGLTDSLTVGRALPGGTYAWFLPTGTRAAVSGRRNDDVRLRLSRAAAAWVPAADVRPLPPGGPAPQAVVGAVRVTSNAEGATVRLPLGQRVPFRVEEDDRTLVATIYGAVGDVDWIRYGAADSLVRRLSWRQTAADEVALTIELARPVWGYRARWDHSDLLLEIRRPPDVDPGDPLRGRVIAVDPGHPPGGATGPTGLREAEANLAVALELRRLLEREGARVLMTRTADTAVDLWPRVQYAERAGAEVLLSIHNNALPDGINPFVNNGSSVYYNQPRSVPLARAIQSALLRRLGLRDLGIGYGDLALVRGTWMPSVLTEGLFMMLPDQEAALRTPEGRHLYAQAVAEGLRRFLEARGRDR